MNVWLREEVANNLRIADETEQVCSTCSCFFPIQIGIKNATWVARVTVVIRLSVCEPCPRILSKRGCCGLSIWSGVPSSRNSPSARLLVWRPTLFVGNDDHGHTLLCQFFHNVKNVPTILGQRAEVGRQRAWYQTIANPRAIATRYFFLSTWQAIRCSIGFYQQVQQWSRRSIANLSAFPCLYVQAQQVQMLRFYRHVWKRLKCWKTIPIAFTGFVKICLGLITIAINDCFTRCHCLS